MKQFKVYTRTHDNLPVRIKIMARNFSHVIEQVEQIKHPKAGVMIARLRV